MKERTRNEARALALRISRAFKDLFVGARGRERRAWRIVMFADDGRTLRRSAEIALADMRNFAFAHPNQQLRLFSTDPLQMARRVGRREMFDRIINYLNLDEQQVQTLMEIDDGE